MANRSAEAGSSGLPTTAGPLESKRGRDIESRHVETPIPGTPPVPLDRASHYGVQAETRLTGKPTSGIILSGRQRPAARSPRARHDSQGRRAACEVNAGPARIHETADIKPVGDRDRLPRATCRRDVIHLVPRIV